MPTPRDFLTRWLPLLIWMGLIFSGSSDVLSGDHTSRFFVPFMHWLFGHRLSLEQIGFLHVLFRKGGHLTEYAVLCVLCWRATASYSLGPIALHPAPTRNHFLVSVTLSALYAASDEFHQSFVPTRTASFYDVMIDTVGAALGLGSLPPAPPSRRPATDHASPHAGLTAG